MKTITRCYKLLSQIKAIWLFSLLIIVSFGVLAQQAPPPPSATITQGRNGSATNPVTPVNWTGGNVGNQQGHFTECLSLIHI